MSSKETEHDTPRRPKFLESLPGRIPLPGGLERRPHDVETSARLDVLRNRLNAAEYVIARQGRTIAALCTFMGLLYVALILSVLALRM